MKSTKKIYFTLLIVMMMFVSLCLQVFAVAEVNLNILEKSTIEKANYLHTLNLYKGTSATEFVASLDAPLTRDQGIIMILRLMGLEDEALKLSDEETDAILSYFIDADQIASWAKKLVAYANKINIVRGFSDRTTRTNEALTGNQFSTLILKVTGNYDEIDVNAFQNAAKNYAILAGLDVVKFEALSNKQLTREFAVDLSYASLTIENKITGTTVIQSLINGGDIVVTNSTNVSNLTIKPNVEPIVKTTLEPTMEPIIEPTMVPIIEPTMVPTIEPTMVPIKEPIIEPTVMPTPSLVSNNGYKKENLNFIAGSGTLYLSQWDKVNPFKVNGTTYSDDTIGIQLYDRDIGMSYETSKFYYLPYANIDNSDLKLNRLKFSVAIDDLGKNFVYPITEAKVYVQGYSSLLGEKNILKYTIDRSREFQQLELDITGFTKITIMIAPPRNGRSQWDDTNNAFYYDGTYRMATNAGKDYVLIKDVEVGYQTTPLVNTINENEYKKTNLDISVGSAANYLSRWDKVNPFKVNGTTYSDDTIGIQLYDRDIGWSYQTSKLYYLPYANIDNSDLKLSKLKFSVAIDDIARNFVYATKGTTIYVQGYSKLKGKEILLSYEIDRNKGFQQQEVDISGYTSITILVSPPRNGMSKVDENNLAYYYDGNSGSASNAFKDYVILKDVEVK